MKPLRGFGNKAATCIIMHGTQLGEAYGKPLRRLTAEALLVSSQALPKQILISYDITNAKRSKILINSCPESDSSFVVGYAFGILVMYQTT